MKSQTTIISLVLATLTGLSGCASLNDGPSLQERVAMHKQAYIDCTDDQATRMIETTDYPPRTVATTAISRCKEHWHAFVDSQQKLYMRQTRQINFGQLQARSAGFDLNIQRHSEIEARVRRARAAAEAGSTATP